MHTFARVGLGIFLIVTGVSHFLAPRYFKVLVPAALPRPGLLVALSGAAEIVIGALLLIPRTREAAGWAAAALLTGYLLSWIDRVRLASPNHRSLWHRRRGAIAGVAVNALYLAWAFLVTWR